VAGPEIVGTFGAVASTHWLATAVAMGMLERGGNAFDAAAAGGFALQAAQPHQHGPGGELPVVFWSADEQRTRVLCGQGVAPAAATPAAFAALGLDAVPGTGLLAACVPGVFDGWMALLAEYGALPLREVLAPTIALLEGGVAAGPWVTAELDAVADHFSDAWPTSEAQWAPQRASIADGGLLRQPALAATYRRVLQHAEAAGPTREAQIEAARSIWSTGFVAEAIDAFARTAWLDTSGRAHAGLLTGDDIARWSAGFEEPAAVEYGRYTVAKTDLWGQGPVFLQQLALLRGFPLADLSEAERAHVVLEASKLAFADREAWYGDAPSRPDVLGELLSPAYTDGRRALIGSTADTSVRPGSPLGLAPRLPAPTSSAGRLGAGVGEPTRGDGVGEPTRRERASVYGDTVHLDVADRWGNLVSATPSGGWLQSSPTVPDLGFALGTRAQMFWLEEGLPSSLVPGTRPRTTLSPGLVLRDGEPWLALGTPGGDQQDQWALGVFLRAVHGDSLSGAIAAPRIHSEHVAQSFYPRPAAPNRAVAEADAPAEVLTDLRARGHEVVEVGAGSQGKVTAVTTAAGVLRAAADGRFGEPHATGR
jgi:gamma-glutamyltranspeptidase/glutathione hydrolase